MSRIGLVISREYLTRVRKKSFLIMTFLTPLLFGGMITLIVWLTATQKDESEKQVLVIDESHDFGQALKNTGNVHFIRVDIDLEDAKSMMDAHYALLHIKGDLLADPSNLEIFSKNQVNLEVQGLIKRQLKRYIEARKIAAYPDIDLNRILKELETQVNIRVIKVGTDGTESQSAFELVMGIGFVAGFMIYITIFIYGAQVMRGVLEEKTGRIVEIIISSVKPFELMMGKIIGLALVGLTQFVLWIILSGAVWSIISVVMLDGGSAAEAMGHVPAEVSNNVGHKVLEMLGSINFIEIAIYFIIYFIGGYFLYASMFAAVGGAVDNESDTQQFVLPITIPLIFALYVGMSVVNNPHGPLAVWCSIIPFTSPVVMMVRIPFEVPLWEKIVSISVLILAFLLMTFLASKIYRTGILMYGKKVSYREIWKWLRH